MGACVLCQRFEFIPWQREVEYDGEVRGWERSVPAELPGRVHGARVSVPEGRLIVVRAKESVGEPDVRALVREWRKEEPPEGLSSTRSNAEVRQ